MIYAPIYSTACDVINARRMFWRRMEAISVPILSFLFFTVRGFELRVRYLVQALFNSTDSSPLLLTW
jgi:hypothetical protein